MMGEMDLGAPTSMRSRTWARTSSRLSYAVLLALLAALAGTAAGCAGGGLRAGTLGTEQEGKATYYAPRLAGHRTANGERYHPERLTAAHPSLPFETYVRVTRLDGSGRSVVVRINDRCAGGRKIIDLSWAAARRLGMLAAGIVRVRLRVVSGPGRD